MTDTADKQEVLQDILDKLSDDVPQVQPSAVDDDDIIDMGDDFDFDGFQVVRREFFAHTLEPAAVFNNCKFYVNMACLRKFPEANAVQVLINRETKIMALLPCPESEKDAFIWCNDNNGRRKPRQVTCRMFFAKIVDLMGWNPDYRYKMLGKMIRANGETLIVFDLKSAEIYQRTYTEEGKVKTARKPVFPAEWQNQFGLPYSEHKKSMQIDIFDGYAVYSLRDISESPPDNPPEIPLPDDKPKAAGQ
ncbi:MAG: hypothetical protein IJG67_02635 [Oscillospiraceae bacterium]|nr:hypothetical protein [Oscillospiraceae bacterium]